MKLKMLTVICVSFLFGCSSGQKELDELCRKDAGTVIYKQVIADGFYYESCKDGCWLELPSLDFKFIEMDNKKTGHKYLSEKGLWKIYVSNFGDPNCNIKMTDGYNFDGLTKEKCFATKKINKLSSRYKHSKLKSQIKLNNANESVISRYVYRIEDMENKDVTAETIRYTLDSKPGTTLDGGPYICKYYAKGKSAIKGLFKDVFIKNLGKESSND